MYNPGVTQLIHQGVLVEILKPSYAVFDPKGYRAGVVAGCAMAAIFPNGNFKSLGAEYDEHEIILVEAAIECLKEEELQAVLAHEKAHIENDDIPRPSGNGIKMVLKLELELRADEAAARATSATAMRNAIIKMQRKQAELLFPEAPEFILKAFTFMTKFGVVNKRLKALDKLIAQGL